MITSLLSEPYHNNKRGILALDANVSQHTTVCSTLKCHLQLSPKTQKTCVGLISSLIQTCITFCFFFVLSNTLLQQVVTSRYFFCLLLLPHAMEFMNIEHVAVQNAPDLTQHFLGPMATNLSCRSNERFSRYVSNKGSTEIPCFIVRYM